MDTILSIYWWGVIAAFVFQLYSVTMYFFGTSERLQYQRNLNRVGLSWDPLYFKIYNASDFKHTMLRYWWHTAWGFLECFLSWLSVCARIYRVMKLRQVRGMLTPEQKQAGFALRNADLSKEEVFKKLKILDLDIREPGDIRLVGVDREDFAHVFARALVDELGRQFLLPLLQASGNTVTKREMVFLKYAIGEDPDNVNLNALCDEYRSSDIPESESEIFCKQLDALKKVFGN
jgi:hypothetical protein